MSAGPRGLYRDVKLGTSAGQNARIAWSTARWRAGRACPARMRERLPRGKSDERDADVGPAV